MARGVNKVILIGNLGFDPEVRYMPSGGAVANLRMATTESWKDKQTGESTEHTEWHRVVLFNRLAEIAGEYLRKGSKIYIEGNIRTRKWQDKDGQDRYTTEIMGRELQMLDGKGASAAPVMNESEGFSKSSSRSSAPQSSASDAPAFDELNDDIPF